MIPLRASSSLRNTDVPDSGPNVGGVFEGNEAELVYWEQYVPVESDWPGIFWCGYNFYVGHQGSPYERGGYVGIQNNGGALIGGVPYINNNICSVWDQVDLPPDVPTEVTLDYGIAGLYSDHFGGEGTGLHTSHPMPWVAGQYYSLVLRRWYIPGERVTRLAFFMYSHTDKEWTHYSSMSIPGPNLSFAGHSSEGFLERFSDDAPLGYRGRWGQLFRMTHDGQWHKPLYYQASAGGDRPHTWNAYLSEPEGWVEVISGGRYENDDNLKELRPVQPLDQPSVAGKQAIIGIAIAHLADSLVVHWRTLPEFAPQLSYKISLHWRQPDGIVLLEKREAVPHLRDTLLSVPGLPIETYWVSVVITDIFNQPSHTAYASFEVKAPT